MRYWAIAGWLCCVLIVLGCLQSVKGPSTSIRERREVEYADGHKEVETIEKTAEAGTVRGKNLKELDPGGASASDDKLEARGFGFKGFLGSSFSPLYVIGGLIFAGGIAAGFLVGWSVGAALAAAGLALLATATLLDTYPWITLIAALAFLGAGAYVLFVMRRGKRAEVVNETVVPAVEELEGLVKDELTEDVSPKAAAKLIVERFKDKIKARAGMRARLVKSEVTRVKRKLNLA